LVDSKKKSNFSLRESDPTSSLLSVGGLSIERDRKISPRPKASIEIANIPPLKNKKGSSMLPYKDPESD
jgi:hypothetical protein